MSATDALLAGSSRPSDPARAASRTGPLWANWATGLWAAARSIPRYCLKYCVLLLAALGLIQLWQAGGDGPIAPFHNLAPDARLDPHHVTAAPCLLTKTDPETRWAAIKPALAILDEVHPDVASWVRETQRRGKLRFSDRWTTGRGGPPCLARYDALRGTLTICPGIFAENDGRIATVLCHEYRHSRQRSSKTILYALSFIWTRGGEPAIIENDALLFEQQAQFAVFGVDQEP
jgi:hypothetical protein